MRLAILLLANTIWMPHGTCWSWNPWLLWSIVGSHAITGLSYYTISIAIVILCRKTIDQLEMRLPRQLYLIAGLFVTFVAACGTGHFVDILTVWVPIYGITAFVQVGIAIVSFAAALYLMPTAEVAIDKIVTAEANEIALAQKYQESEFFFQLSPIPMYRKNESGQIVDCNQAVQKLLGFSRDDMIGKRDTEFLENREGALQIEQTDRELFSQGEGATAEVLELATGRDGKLRRFVSKKSIYRDPASSSLCLSGVSLDVTGQLEIQESLQAVNESLQAANQELDRASNEMETIFQMSSAIYSAKSYGEIHQLMQVAANLLLSGVSGALYTISNSGTHAEMRCSWGDVPSESIFAPDQCWSLRRGGTTNLLQRVGCGLACDHLHLPIEGSHLCTPLNGVINTTTSFGVLYMHSDRPISDSHQRIAKNLSLCISLALANLELRDRLKNQSLKDALMGLYNRRFLEDALKRECSIAACKESPFGVIFLDVDNFKTYNSNFGHEVGDLVLKEIGSVIKASIRSGDLPCRFGGEEIVILVVDTDLHQITALADRVREAIERMNIVTQNSVLPTVTASFGVALFPEHSDDPAKVLHLAESAMRRAKSEGKNRVVVFER